jgi:hypothetical protein
MPDMSRRAEQAHKRLEIHGLLIVRFGHDWGQTPAVALRGTAAAAS